MVNGSSAPWSDQPRNRATKDRASYLATRSSLSFDPHPIDQLALNCLLVEGVGGTLKAIQHGPAFSLGNSVTLSNLRPTEQGTQIFYSTLPGEQ